MAKEKSKEEPKMILEREYIVPLRAGWLKVAKHKRANKATKTLKEFIARHMKIYDRDLRRIKIDEYLNNEIRFRGMRKPPAKIKVIAKKFNDETVRVELSNLPKHVEFEKKRKDRFSSEIKKKIEEKGIKQEDKEIKQESAEKAEEAKEKEQASREDSLEISKEQAREMKHVSKPKDSMQTQNMGNKRASRTK
jgi:ribosomal protein L31E